MKSLIFTNPTTKETFWCVADIECDFSVEQYINVVNVGGIAEEHYSAANFAFIDQPVDVSMSTHKYTDQGFEKLPDLESVRVKSLSA